MKYIVYYIFIMIIFSGCSFKTPVNHSQYKASNAFSSYTNNFLSENDIMAKNDIKRAIKYAKTNADLNALARIYLGECALNISIGIDNSCAKYKNIEKLVEDSSLDAYYSLITLQLKREQLKYLPKRYKDVAFYIIDKKFDKAYDAIINLNNATSQMLLFSLIKENLDENKIEEIIKIASFNGYKRSIIFWLNELKNITKDTKLKNYIIKRILILNS